MFPSKNMYDYMNEINRLFPRPMENEIQMQNYNNAFRQSPFNTTAMANHSSSSADSISPEIFPHFSPVVPRSRTGMDNRSLSVKHSLSDTPFQPKRQRAIVGRKILGNTDCAPPRFDTSVNISPVKSIESEDFSRTWESLNQHTPPNQRFEQSNYSPNVYELFPVESRGFEFRTPVKSSVTSTSFSVNMSVSPNSTVSMSPVSSKLSCAYPTPPPMYRRNIVSNFPSTSTINREVMVQKICTFCRKNGETPMVYMTHTVKEVVGNRNVVSCPILRSHICSSCGASGDNAHTITYCPVLRSNNNGRPLPSTTITLKNTRVKSNGRKRY